MTTEENSPLFEFSVPVNNETLLHLRKNMITRIGLGCLLSALTLALFPLVIFPLTLPEDLVGKVYLYYTFIAFILVSLIASVIFFICGKCLKNKPQNDKINYLYQFYQEGIIISKNSLNNIEKHEAKKICRYRPHKDAQYIAKILEYKDYLSFWVCVGTYNFVAPVYKQYNLPKNIIHELEQPQFIEFLKTIFKKAYKIKYKK